jgi:hypothetical protein
MRHGAEAGTDAEAFTKQDIGWVVACLGIGWGEYRPLASCSELGRLCDADLDVRSRELESERCPSSRSGCVRRSALIRASLCTSPSDDKTRHKSNTKVDATAAPSADRLVILTHGREDLDLDLRRVDGAQDARFCPRSRKSSSLSCVEPPSSRSCVDCYTPYRNCIRI